MKRLTLAVLMVAFLAMPAFASVQNVKVSGSIDSTWLVRDQFDLGLPEVTGKEFYQNILITQAILRVDADLTDNVSTTIQLINERPWGDEGRDQTGTARTLGAVDSNLTINLAYVKLKEMLYSPLTVIIGRQQFSYGNSLVVSSGGPNNTSVGVLGLAAADLSKRRAFDAVRAVLDYNPLTLDIFAVKVDAQKYRGAVTSATAGVGDDDINLYGINANYKLGDAKNTEAEAYFFARTNESTQAGDPNNGGKADTVFTPGLRASTNPIKGLNVQGEVAWQFGNRATTSSTGAARTDNQRREAMAAQIITSYAIDHSSVNKWKPVVTLAGTYLSGDANAAQATGRNGFTASTEKYTAWDPMFENQSGGTIYNTLFDYSNALIATGTLQVTPIEDVLAKLTFTSLWLATDLGYAGGTPVASGVFIMRQPDGTTVNPVGTTNRNVGNEIDVDLTYDYTEDVKLGFSAGWFIPGPLFDVNTNFGTETLGNNQIASQYLTSVGVNF